MENNFNKSLSSLLELNNTGIQDIGIEGFLLVMTVSLISSFYVSMLYLRFYGSRATGSQIHRAFPLLGMSITAIFICIQFSLPLSLGLLGALSIVRFRTPIKEPEEIGFIMLIVGSSIAIATFSLYFLLILLTFATIAMLIQQFGFGFLSRTVNDGMILLTIPTNDYQINAEKLNTLFKQNLAKPKIESVTKSGENSVVSYSFTGLKSDDPITLQSEISRLLETADVNIYLNKQATL